MRGEKLKFSTDQLNMIFEDQKNALENIHEGPICPSLQDCPGAHFGCEDIDEIELRQSIMKAILAEANES